MTEVCMTWLFPGETFIGTDQKCVFMNPEKINSFAHHCWKPGMCPGMPADVGGAAGAWNDGYLAG